jgi:transposase-like protein
MAGGDWDDDRGGRPAGAARGARRCDARDAFPAEHWSKLRSTNPLERFNREIGRRTDVVGVFLDDTSLLRLVSMLAIEANDCRGGGPPRFAVDAFA